MGWISVNDRLPIDGGRILVAVVGVDSEGMREEAGVFFARYNNNRFLIYVDDAADTLVMRNTRIYTSWGMVYSITHWIPLPDMPEEVKRHGMDKC